MMTAKEAELKQLQDDRQKLRQQFYEERTKVEAAEGVFRQTQAAYQQWAQQATALDNQMLGKIELLEQQIASDRKIAEMKANVVTTPPGEHPLDASVASGSPASAVTNSRQNQHA
jgi:hypothetical protein